MRPDPAFSSAKDRHAYTCGLRRRAQRAEAEAARQRQARKEAEDHAEALSQRIEAERAALLSYLESPDWAREVLLLAQDHLREEMTALSLKRQCCASCGGLGRGAYAGFLTARIAALTEDHDLPPVAIRPEPRWPLRPGAKFHDGTLLQGDWLDT